MAPKRERLDLAMEALAHPARRAILQRLGSGEARVTEVAAPFDMSLNAVSKHIMVLEGAGLVRRRRIGREHVLSVEPRGLDGVAAWVEEQRATWKRRLEAMDAALRDRDRPGARTPAGTNRPPRR